MEVFTEIQILSGLLGPLEGVGDPRLPGRGSPPATLCLGLPLLLAAGLGCLQRAGRCTVVLILADALHHQRLAGNLVFPFSFG